MPTLDDDLRRRLRTAAPRASGPPPSVDAISARAHRRALRRRASAILVVAVIVVAAIAAVGLASRQQTALTPGNDETPVPLVENLGLPFPVCRVSTMPSSTAAGLGSAAVFTESSDGRCPSRGDGFTGVGVDVDGNGVLDATFGPLPDCWYRCEAFAAPDVNDDGVSEIAVSTEGAEGYGVFLYSVTTDPPAIEPIVVTSSFDRGPSDGDPLQFAWVDVATHASSADCVTTADEEPLLDLYTTEKLTPAQVQTVSIQIAGATATVTAIATDTMPLDRAPMPSEQLCGAPIYGPALGLASAAPVSP